MDTRLSAALTSPDLDAFEKELDQRQRGVLLDALDELPAILQFLALAVFAVMMREDLRVAVSPRVRLVVVERRVIETLAAALADGTEVGQALTRAMELVDEEWRHQIQRAHKLLNDLAEQLADPAFAARYEDRIYVVESVLDRCSELLAAMNRST